MITHAGYAFPITLSELAVAVTGCAPRLRRDLLERRLMHWSNVGVLRTLGPVKTGRGKSRLFRPEDAYVAAILLKLTEFGLSIAALKFVERAIADARTRNKEAGDLWDEAIARVDIHRCVFLTLRVELDDAGETPVSAIVGFLRGEGLMVPRHRMETDSAILINATDIFSHVGPL